MAVRRLEIRNLRNLSHVTISPAAQRNLLMGGNGSGKTSVLEALFLLGRGRSFRKGDARGLVGGEGRRATVAAALECEGGERRLAVSRDRDGSLAAKVDGGRVSTAGELAAVLPVRFVGPESERLVEGGSRERQRFLDWGVFHVKPMLRPAYGRLRRVLEQRNAALRAASSEAVLEAWDGELERVALILDEARDQHSAAIREALAGVGLMAAPFPAVELEYRAGWDRASGLRAHLRRVRDRDRERGYTTVGPQRAELRIVAARAPAAGFLSRGQQKILATSLFLAQILVVYPVLEGRLVVLLDDLPSELDRASLAAVLTALARIPLQLFVTTVDADWFTEVPFQAVFHVEQGRVRQMV
jgi:DNA replication and repair protein RecF